MVYRRFRIRVSRENVFARPGADDKPIIPVLSRRIMSAYDASLEPGCGFLWAILASGEYGPPNNC